MNALQSDHLPRYIAFLIDTKGFFRGLLRQMSDVNCHTDTKDGLPCTDYFHIAYAPPLGAVDV